MSNGRKQRRPSRLYNLYQNDLDRHLFVFTVPGGMKVDRRSLAREDAGRLRDLVQSGWERCKAVAEAACLL